MLCLYRQYDSDMNNTAINREASKSESSGTSRQQALTDNNINLTEFGHRKSDKQSLFSAINQKVRVQ